MQTCEYLQRFRRLREERMLPLAYCLFSSHRMFYRAAFAALTGAAAGLLGRLPLLLLPLLLLLAGRAGAQPGTGGPAPAPAAVPLDGGATLVLAAGAAYGLRRLRRPGR